MGLVFSGWRELSAEAIAIAREGIFTILSRVQTSTNGLYESLTGAPAPGRSGRSAMAHDHTESGGGAILPRGVVYCLDNGDGDGWEWIVPLASAPITDKAYFYDFSAAADTRVPTLRLWTTDGINSTKTNRASNDCALEGKMIVYLKNSHGSLPNDFTFKWRNEATGATSTGATQSIGIGLGDVVEIGWGDIPLAQTSGLQELTLLVSATKHADIRIQSLVIAETRETSQPASAGGNRYNSATATTRED